MSPVPCSGCGEKMSASAVVCPHCGARQSDRDPVAAYAHKRATSRDDGVAVDPYRGQPTPPPDPEQEEEAAPEPSRRSADAPLEINGEEARALLEVTGMAHGAMEYERPLGPMVLVLPRAESAGLTRSLEWALTVVAAPMIVLGLFPALIRPRLWRYISEGSEWGLTSMSCFFGGFILWSGGELAGLSAPLTWGIVAISGGAMLARAGLRSVSGH